MTLASLGFNRAITDDASASASPAPNLSTLGPETGWAEFKSFAYEGRDRFFDQEPPSATQYYNPIVAGFYPDPSICRVGNDYYLINSSFAYFPGVPIFHSTDLVNWTQIGHVLDRPSQLNLDGTAVSQGVFAPAITYHDGLFYVITTGVYSGGNFVVTAKNPAGPWSDPMPLKFGGIDPSIFFDEDGKAYIVHNGDPSDNKPLYSGHRAVWLWGFDPRTGTVSNGRIIVNGGVDISQKPSWIEGPHIFKRNGWYYLTCAEGGTGPDHSQVIFRTRSLSEPFVPGPHNPILTQRNLDRNRPNPVTALGHADLVKAQNGEWWAVFLGIRPYENGMSNLGRETFLLPVTWENDWPTILKPGQVMPRVVKRPNLPVAQKTKVLTTGSFSWSDEFNERQLGMPWMFLRNPREQWWSLAAKPGSLLIAPRDVPLKSVDRKDVNVNRNPSFIARRQQHHDFSARTSISINPATADSEVGLAALHNNTNYLFLGVRIKDGKAQQIFLEQHHEKSAAPETLATTDLPVDAREIELRMEGAGRDYDFSYRMAGGKWTSVKENVDGSLLARGRGFVGAVLGPYVRSLPATETTASLSTGDYGPQPHHLGGRARPRDDSRRRHVTHEQHDNAHESRSAHHEVQ
jgi:alpha-N-arabinofuranosidase